MNNESHSWSKEDSIRSIRDIINVGKTALSGFISWANEIPSRIDTHMAGGDVEDE